MTLLAIGLAGLGSYLLRSFFVLAYNDREMPAALTTASSLVAPAAFAAIAATGVFGHLAGDLGGSLPLLTGLVAAALATHKTGSANTALLVGLPTIWLMSALL